MIKSKSQHRRLTQLVKEGKMTKAEFDRWTSETPDLDKLPERASKKSLKVKKVKVV